MRPGQTRSRGALKIFLRASEDVPPSERAQPFFLLPGCVRGPLGGARVSPSGQKRAKSARLLFIALLGVNPLKSDPVFAQVLWLTSHCAPEGLPDAQQREGGR